MKSIFKKSIAVLLVFTMTLMLFGCGSNAANTDTNGNNSSNNTSNTDNTNNADTSKNNAVEYKDTYTFAQAADITSLDPNETTSIVTLDVLCCMYETLVTFDKDMKITPLLAKEYNQIDETTWEFKLVDNATFHNGNKFTAADVEYSLNREMNLPKTKSLLSSIKNIEVVDDTTVRIQLTEANGAFLNNLANACIAMLSKDYMTEKGEDILKTEPVGTGAYKFVEWKQGNYVKFEAFDGYWAGAPKTKNVVMKVIPEAAQRTIAVELGEVDVAYGIQPNDIEKIRSEESLVLLNEPSLVCTFMTMNFDKEPYKNQKVREAVRLAIDSQIMADKIYYGAAVPDNTLIPMNAFGYQPDAKQLAQDKEKAKQLLKEAGYENGFQTNIYTSDTQTAVEVCQIIQAQLKEVGIDCEVKSLEFGTFLDKVSKGEQDLCLMTWSTSTVDADFTYYGQLHSDNYGVYGNMISKDLFPGLDENIDKARKTADQDVRMECYKNVEKICAENSIDRPLICRNVSVALSKKVEGFVLKANEVHNFVNVTVQK